MLQSHLFPCSGHSVASRGLVTGGSHKGRKKEQISQPRGLCWHGDGAMPAFSEPFLLPLGSSDPKQSPRRALGTHLSRTHSWQGRTGMGEKKEMQFPGNKKPRVLLEALPARWCRAVFSCTGRSMQLLGRDKEQKKNAPRSELSILITSLGGGRALGEMLKHTHPEQRRD